MPSAPTLTQLYIPELLEHVPYQPTLKQKRKRHRSKQRRRGL